MCKLAMCRMVQYTNGQYVADIKLNYIRNIVEQAQKAKHICRIMLFGSSIEERCSADSDIDIAVFGDKAKGSYIDSKEFKSFKKGLFQFDWNQHYHVLYFVESKKYNDNIMSDIERGVEIFRRS